MSVARLDNTRISERGNAALTSAKPVNDRWVKQAEQVRARKDSFFPSHVKACAHNPMQDRVWTLATWERTKPHAPTLTPYTCGSFRCPSPECQRAAAHSAFAKIKEGLERAKVAGALDNGWVSIVLTIDAHGTLTRGVDANGEPWRNEQHAYAELSRNSRNFMARLKRWGKAEGWEETGNRWVATVEAQRNGMPHLNLLIYSPGLAQWLDEHPSGIPTEPGALRGMLLECAVGTCWGAIGYAERARDSSALAGYLVKLAGNHDATVGEIAKLTQSPTNARMKLRRIRAGKGFLQQREKNPAYTGIMLKRVMTVSGKTAIDTLMKPDSVRKPPEEIEPYLLGVRTSMALELERAIAIERGEAVKAVSRPEDRKKRDKPFLILIKNEVPQAGPTQQQLIGGEHESHRKTVGRFRGKGAQQPDGREERQVAPSLFFGRRKLVFGDDERLKPRCGRNDGRPESLAGC